MLITKERPLEGFKALEMINLEKNMKFITLGNTLPQGIVVTFEVGLNSVFGPL